MKEIEKNYNPAEIEDRLVRVSGRRRNTSTQK